MAEVGPRGPARLWWVAVYVRTVEEGREQVFGMKRLSAILAAFALALALLPSAFAAAGGPPATFSTVNTGVDGTGHCKNGPADAVDVVNCNIYDGKQYVWLNGGPVRTTAALRTCPIRRRCRQAPPVEAMTA